MIKNLLDFFEINFPVLIISRKDYPKLKETTNRIYFGDKYVLKQKNNLLEEFDILHTYTPKTLSYLALPEILLSNLPIVQHNYILDSKFNVFILVDAIQVAYFTTKIYKTFGKYFKVKQFSYFFEQLTAQPSNKHEPVLALVNNVAYFIGWSDEPISGKTKL